MSKTKQSEIQKLKNELATLEGRPATMREPECEETWEERVRRIFDKALAQKPVEAEPSMSPVAPSAAPVRKQASEARTLRDRIADARRFYDRQLEDLSDSC